MAPLIWFSGSPMLSQAIGTMQARGYNYKFAGAWAKQFSTGSKRTFGTGYCYWRYGPSPMQV